MDNVFEFKPRAAATPATEPVTLEEVMRRNEEKKRKIERERAEFIKKNRNKPTFYNKPMR